MLCPIFCLLFEDEDPTPTPAFHRDKWLLPVLDTHTHTNLVIKADDKKRKFSLRQVVVVVVSKEKMPVICRIDRGATRNDLTRGAQSHRRKARRKKKGGFQRPLPLRVFFSYFWFAFKLLHAALLFPICIGT